MAELYTETRGGFSGRATLEQTQGRSSSPGPPGGGHSEQGAAGTSEGGQEGTPSSQKLGRETSQAVPGDRTAQKVKGGKLGGHC